MTNPPHATDAHQAIPDRRLSQEEVARPCIERCNTAAVQWIQRLETFDIVAAMTLFVVFVVAHTLPYQCVTLVATFVAIRWRAVRNRPWIWFGLAACFVPRLVNQWYQNEDHVYLSVYWCVAVGLSRWGAGNAEVLSRNARLLIGLAFAFATFWKIVTPQFYDGSLCSYKLVSDFRFRNVITQPLLGLTDAQVRRNNAALVSLRETGSPLTQVTLQYPNSVVWAGRALAAWTILIEATLAIAFLLPSRIVGAWVRNGTLLLFSLSTYLVVPVLGFGTLFMTMGIAQTDDSERRTRLAFLATAWLILLRFTAS